MKKDHKQPDKIPTDKERGSAFLDYVKHLPEGPGKRFVIIHTKKCGADKFFEFWEKMRKAFATKNYDIKLSPEENESLAEALMPKGVGRRMALGMGLGASVAAIMTAVGSVNLIRHFTDERKDPNLLEHILQIVLGTVTIGGGLAIGTIIGMIAEGGYQDVLRENMASARDKEVIARMVDTLDKCFRPIEQAMSECGISKTQSTKPRSNGRIVSDDEPGPSIDFF